MANTGLAFNDSAGGNRGYNGLWIGNVSEFVDADKPSFFKEAFLAAKKDDVLPTVVNVAAGVPMLSGSLLDEDGISTPPGIIVTITKPDNTALDISKEVFNDDLMIHLDSEGNLASFMVKNPMQGNWTISVQDTLNKEPAFQLFVSTSPTGTGVEGDVAQTLHTVFRDRYTAEQLDGFVERFEFVTWGCFFCQLGFWVLAGIIIFVLFAFNSTLTVASPLILTVMTWFTAMSAVSALAMVRGLIGVIVFGVGAVSNKICGWIGACSNAVEEGTDGTIPQGGY
jgi:hypothetical protein